MSQFYSMMRMVESIFRDTWRPLQCCMGFTVESSLTAVHRELGKGLGLWVDSCSRSRYPVRWAGKQTQAEQSHTKPVQQTGGQSQDALRGLRILALHPHFSKSPNWLLYS